MSGLSAAHTVYLNGGNVLVLDKQGMSLSLRGLFLWQFRMHIDGDSFLWWQLDQGHFRD